MNTVLSKHEEQLIRQCLLARTQVSNGYFLPAHGRFKVARRLVDRGFLTLADEVCASDGAWPVVKIEQANLDAITAAIRALIGEAGG